MFFKVKQLFSRENLKKPSFSFRIPNLNRIECLNTRRLTHVKKTHPMFILSVCSRPHFAQHILTGLMILLPLKSRKFSDNEIYQSVVLWMFLQDSQPRRRKKSTTFYGQTEKILYTSGGEGGGRNGRRYY